MKIIKKLFLMTVITAGLMPMVGVCAAEGNDAPEEERKEASAVSDEQMQLNRELMCAIYISDTALAGELIDAGANVNNNLHNCFPLLQAIDHNDSAMIDMLINKGADINKETKERGTTALLQAIERRDTAMAKKLISKGADVNKSNSEGRSPLLAAAEKNDSYLVRILIDAGATYNYECPEPRQVARQSARAVKTPPGCLAEHYFVPYQADRLIVATMAVKNCTGEQRWDELDLYEILSQHINSSDISNLVAAYAASHYNDNIFSSWLNGDKCIQSIVGDYLVDRSVASGEFEEEFGHYYRVIQEIAFIAYERREERKAQAMMEEKLSASHRCTLL